ncbi:hypothetical protein H6F43_16895 [Leptolyngbya sp. FACHB-36]|uniref:hypothetical protein n=1 Tax=Leptolyngbya sp. FACHB-36 TaxID=2692808 RepID=UPI001680011F|nr:hypothetical protein [Leptolyngbya sp. FACHB-36]MBD2021860.1 hypothetical protein [Leptolyngbya sp. FACHB-36]
MLLLTAGCAASMLEVAPDKAVYQQISCPKNGQKAQSYQVLSTQKWSRGVVVLYSALCPTGNQMPARRVFGHKVVERNGMNWQVSGSDSFRTKPTSAKSERLIDYSISQSTAQSRDRYAILYGQIIATKVVAVEATFDNGQILRDEGSNGVFALVSPGATGVCEVRIFGNDNQILQQDDLALPRRLLSREQQPCYSNSHRL